MGQFSIFVGVVDESVQIISLDDVKTVNLKNKKQFFTQIPKKNQQNMGV